MNGRVFVKELGKKARRKFAICLPGSPFCSSKKNVDQLGDFGESIRVCNVLMKGNALRNEQ